MRYASGKTTNRDVKNETETPPERRRSQLGGRLWKAGMGLSLIVVGSVFVNYLWSSYQRAAVMDSWVETPCTIQSFTVDDSELNQRGMPKYVVEVRYLYEFEGEDYIGDRLVGEGAEVDAHGFGHGGGESTRLAPPYGRSPRSLEDVSVGGGAATPGRRRTGR